MPQKWGQHFLVRPIYIEKMLEVAEIQEGDKILEIGPGKGVLTRAMLNQGAKVTAVEVDPELAAYLNQDLVPNSNFTLVHQDILSLQNSDLQKLFDGPFKIVANLPYNIATAIFFKVLEIREQLSSVTIMVQKEVAERMCATTDQRKAYGALSVAADLTFEREYSFTIPPDAYAPPPKVDSAVVHLHPKPMHSIEKGEQIFLRWVQEMFNQRRKTLLNNLRRCSPEFFEAHKFSLTQEFESLRVETLSTHQLLDLFQRIP